jgi:hypothetical protein
MTRGIVFFGSGKSYAEQALAAAKRSIRFNNVPHMVYSSERLTDADSIAIQQFAPTSTAYRLDRIECLLSCPFDEVIYLDADCDVVTTITELYDLLDAYDLAAAHAPGYRGRQDPSVPASFYEMNCGVLVFRLNDRIRDVLRAWQSCYREWLEKPLFPGCVPFDQPSFRHTVWGTKTPVYILGPEYNWRPWMNSFLCDEVKIIHTYSDAYDKLATLANSQSGPRIFPPLAGARQFL